MGKGCMWRRALLGIFGAAAAMALPTGEAQAQASVEAFYKGRQMTMIVYSPPGSTYDIYARALVRHMDRHIPGKPNFITQNMPGAGGLKATDYLYNIAPKDGSVIGTIGRGLPFEGLGQKPISFLFLRFGYCVGAQTGLGIGKFTEFDAGFAF